MHGLGNNYIYLNCISATPNDLPELAQQVANPNFGIGSDGLVCIQSSDSQDFKMKMLNSDGSEAEMCGNAVRCIAKYLYDKDICKKERISLETKAGEIILNLNISNNQLVDITVDMGKPILIPGDIPVKIPNYNESQIINHPFNFFGQDFHINCVSMGNPHVIMFVDKITDELVLELGPQIEKHEIFPNKVNVEFVEVISPSNLKMRVWERGTGETFACGTGACAVAVAAILNNLVNNDVTINLLGGDLQISWDGTASVYKTGTADFICDGEFYLNQ